MPHLMFLNPWYSGQGPGGGNGPGGPASPHPATAAGPPVPPKPTLLHGSPQLSAKSDRPSKLPIVSSLVGGDSGKVDAGQLVLHEHDLLLSNHELSEDQNNHLSSLQEGLRAGWTVHMTPDGRFYYCK